MTPPLFSPFQHISTSAQDEFPLTDRGRIFLVLWSTFLLIGFAVALSLEPSPRGYGTHQQLGLPPCTIKTLTKAGCPVCGMTTSFSHFVRGQFIRSAQANLAGILLASGCALMIPWCWVSAYRGRCWRVVYPEWTLVWFLSLVMFASTVQWAIRFFWR